MLVSTLVRMVDMDREQLASGLDTAGMSWDDVALVFENAWRLLQANGWCQGNYARLVVTHGTPLGTSVRDGSLVIPVERHIASCATGAVNISVTGLWFDGTEHAGIGHDYSVIRKGNFVRAVFARYLVLSGRLESESDWDPFSLSGVPDRHIAAIARWNDAEGRTADEVIAALRACSEACRA